MAALQDDVILTQGGYDELVAELKQIKEEKLPKAIERVATARSFGDLSENSEYHAAREDLSFLEGRTAELEIIVANAKVIKQQKGKKTQVTVGSTVTVHIGKSKHVYQIVGEWEADPKEKKISEESPLGKALLGKKIGEEIDVNAPAGKIKYKVAAIE
jgi:transcription elongation factor GreA